MTTEPASLWPVAGTARDIAALLEPWVREGGEPIQVRTSGSTGTPKIIRLSHAAVLASAHATLARLGGPGTWLLSMPPTGMGGLQVLVRSFLAGQAPVFAEDYPDLMAAIEAMGTGRRYLSFVPTQFYRLAEQHQLHRLADVDAVLLGGAATSPGLLDQARAAGVRVVRTYGMTETAGGCVYDGIPLDGVQIRIESDGRVSIAGPVLCEGVGEWFTTQDLGRFADDGRLEVVGRADQVAVSGGVNVPLALVESVLRDVPGVDDVVVVAVPDAEWGQAVVAWVMGKLDRESAARALSAAGHPRAFTPRAVHRVAQFPLLSTGKVDRLRLAERS